MIFSWIFTVHTDSELFPCVQAFITFLCLYGMVWYAETYGPREKVSTVQLTGALPFLLRSSVRCSSHVLSFTASFFWDKTFSQIHAHTQNVFRSGFSCRVCRSVRTAFMQRPETTFVWKVKKQIIVAKWFIRWLTNWLSVWTSQSDTHTN